MDVRTQQATPLPAMRARQAAAFLGIGESTFWRWVSEGKLPPPTKLGTRVSIWPTEKLIAIRDGEKVAA
jgi:predicted DNA-binding transcriptional regulator AlpA